MLQTPRIMCEAKMVKLEAAPGMEEDRGRPTPDNQGCTLCFVTIVYTLR
jgi:hypothetical protein